MRENDERVTPETPHAGENFSSECMEGKMRWGVRRVLATKAPRKYTILSECWASAHNAKKSGRKGEGRGWRGARRPQWKPHRRREAKHEQEKTQHINTPHTIIKTPPQPVGTHTRDLEHTSPQLHTTKQWTHSFWTVTKPRQAQLHWPRRKEYPGPRGVSVLRPSPRC